MLPLYTSASHMHPRILSATLRSVLGSTRLALKCFSVFRCATFPDGAEYMALAPQVRCAQILTWSLSIEQTTMHC